MTAANDGDVACPNCGHSNPPKSSYCWECRSDFVPDNRPRAPIPPPYSRPQAAVAAKAGRERGSVTAFAFELLFSAIIVGSSWFVLLWFYPSMDVISFVAGWGAALLLVKVSEGYLRDPETDASKYWSMNPFEYRDNRNRFVLQWHVILFLPRVVLRTIRSGFAVVSSSS